MTRRPLNKQPQGADLIGQVDELADQVKNLALNLAITLAREKERVKDLKIIEPEFTHLINKSVGVVREIANILMLIGAEEPRTAVESERLRTIEKSLEEILVVAENVLKEIRVLKQRKGMVDKYK
jgi:hypothetical protein